MSFGNCISYNLRIDTRKCYVLIFHFKLFKSECQFAYPFLAHMGEGKK